MTTFFNGVYPPLLDMDKSFQDFMDNTANDWLDKTQKISNNVKDKFFAGAEKVKQAKKKLGATVVGAAAVTAGLFATPQLLGAYTAFHTVAQPFFASAAWQATLGPITGAIGPQIAAGMTAAAAFWPAGVAVAGVAGAALAYTYFRRERNTEQLNSGNTPALLPAGKKDLIKQAKVSIDKINLPEGKTIAQQASLRSKAIEIKNVVFNKVKDFVANVKGQFAAKQPNVSTVAPAKQESAGTKFSSREVKDDDVLRNVIIGKRMYDKGFLARTWDKVKDVASKIKSKIIPVKPPKGEEPKLPPTSLLRKRGLVSKSKTSQPKTYPMSNETVIRKASMLDR